MKKIEHEVKGSIAQSPFSSYCNMLDIMERITDIDSRLHQIESKLKYISDFIVSPKSEAEDDWVFDIKVGGTD